MFNLYMNAFCESCGVMKSKPRWEPQAFVCRICDGGFDERYAGQHTCDACQEGLIAGYDW